MTGLRILASYAFVTLGGVLLGAWDFSPRGWIDLLIAGLVAAVVHPSEGGRA